MLRAPGKNNPRDRNSHPLSEIAFLIEIASNPGRLRSWTLLFIFFFLPSSLSTPKQKEDKEGNFAHTKIEEKKKKGEGVKESAERSGRVPDVPG